MIKIYGLKNCDSVRKALKWFAEKGIDFQFHDFRKQGLERELLESWIQELGVEILLNKRGTTWRRLPEDQKNNLSEKGVINLLLEYPAMIKRPVLDFGDKKRIGFSKKDQDAISEIFKEIDVMQCQRIKYDS